MNRRQLLRSALCGVAISTGLGRTAIALPDPPPADDWLDDALIWDGERFFKTEVHGFKMVDPQRIRTPEYEQIDQEKYRRAMETIEKYSGAANFIGGEWRFVPAGGIKTATQKKRELEIDIRHHLRK